MPLGQFQLACEQESEQTSQEFRIEQAFDHILLVANIVTVLLVESPQQKYRPALFESMVLQRVHIPNSHVLTLSIRELLLQRNPVLGPNLLFLVTKR
ncbi:hypothetical protein D3C71_1980440 [compost metagenome]